MSSLLKLKFAVPAQEDSSSPEEITEIIRNPEVFREYFERHIIRGFAGFAAHGAEHNEECGNGKDFAETFRQHIPKGLPRDFYLGMAAAANMALNAMDVNHTRGQMNHLLLHVASAAAEEYEELTK